MFYFYAFTLCCLLWVLFHCSVNCVDIDIETIWRECNETFPASEESLISFGKNGTIPDENDSTARCFADCYGKKTTMLTSDGSLNWTTLDFIMRSYNMKPTATETFGKCQKDTSNVECMKSYLSLRCVAETIASLSNIR
uniref:Odorant-binding protein 12 n=1 Tax=Oedaleus asiaticus TaxID=244712 RepID=A0A0E3T5L9_9ORTH|nr:odorant-binding protein 12 [Oedaleus asiaticus]